MHKYQSWPSLMVNKQSRMLFIPCMKSCFSYTLNNQTSFKMSTFALKFIDIGANLVDNMYTGVYHGSQKHEPDLTHVLQRAWKSGVDKIILTGTSLSESEKAIETAKQDDRLFATIGCHPTSCSEIANSEDPDMYISNMVNLCREHKGKVVAVGEFGLDNDRLQFCSKDIQMKYFEKQLMSYQELNLPLFLHCRNAADDLLEILVRNRERWSSGVFHSFDGSEQTAKEIIDLGLHIGINGCSLKTEENLQVVKTIPADKLLLETDSPWCEIRPTHAGFKYIQTKFASVKKEKWDANSMVKGRNEPVTIRQVLEVVAAVRGEDAISLGKQIHENTNKLFFSNHYSSVFIY